MMEPSLTNAIYLVAITTCLVPVLPTSTGSGESSSSGELQPGLADMKG